MLSSSRPSISQAWRYLLPPMHFLGGISSGPDPRLKEDLCRYSFGFKSIGYHNRGRGYGTENGKSGSNDECNDVRAGNTLSSNSQCNDPLRYKNYSSTDNFGRSRRSQSHNLGISGGNPITRRMRASGRRGGTRGGFRMPDFDPGNDQLKKIFESQMDSTDQIDEIDLGEVGPIEGNFRDDDDSEAEDYNKTA